MGEKKIKFLPQKFKKLFYGQTLPKIKIVSKILILVIFGQRFDKSSDSAELNRRREVSNSAKWPQHDACEMGKNRNISLQKI